MKIEEFKSIKIPIVEIFNSISGEGISAGEVVTFVRVAGCNLRCTYCDTTYSYNQGESEYQYLTLQEILAKVEEFNCKQVICTGGEPLEMNKFKRYLPAYLANKGYQLRIESNGSCPVYSEAELRELSLNESKAKINYTLDIKTPSSAMVEHNIFADNFNKLKLGDELKFVVADDKDLEYAKSVLSEYKAILAKNNIVINFSPVFGEIEANQLVEFLKRNNADFINDNLKVRLSLQIHKVIWEPEAKGV